jgi:hypothetical protein
MGEGVCVCARACVRARVLALIMVPCLFNMYSVSLYYTSLPQWKMVWICSEVICVGYSFSKLSFGR